MSESASPLAGYLKQIEKRASAGNATEHTYRPALQELLESLVSGITAVNEPKRSECGAPDYVVTQKMKFGPLTIGYVEAKDLGVSLDEIEKSEQLKRYRAALPNLILTDYLEFRHYVDGERRTTARAATVGHGGKIKPDADGMAAAADLLTDFLKREPAEIAKPHELAERMARLTHIIRDIIVWVFNKGQESNTLKDLRAAFTKALIPDLDQPEKTADFADMYAQTIAYGLFAARCNHPPGVVFRRKDAAAEIPKTNPFLRTLFNTIAGPDLEDEPYAGFVEDLAGLLQHTDMGAVLEHFGRRTNQEDPIVHFYETFLTAYDPKLRKTRGVFFTPTPVVSYIVRSVDYLLKTRFNCPGGLADKTTVEYERATTKDGETKKVKDASPRVLILDPACGTATFLYFVIDHIRRQFMESGNAGMWSGYVKNHLLPRIFGFELLMAPYSIAHLKLGMQLAGQDLPEATRKKWAYDFSSDERLGVYLTNTLEEPEKKAEGLFGPYRVITQESEGAARIKKDLPIMVVLGNPPYSGVSANMGRWIQNLLRGLGAGDGQAANYYEADGRPLGEKKIWLQDDYVKFIRWGQWRIERTGAGILAFITNNGYLDNPTFRGMRQALLNTFNEIYLLDLHGNAKKKELSPDGAKDENVFDIQQGVCLGIFVKTPGRRGPTTVRHAEIWGTRAEKYRALAALDLKNTNHTVLQPSGPYYFFVPRTEKRRSEYERTWKITDIMPVNVAGIVTARDHLVVGLEERQLLDQIRNFADERYSDKEIREKYFTGKGSSKYKEGDTRGWSLSEAREKVRADKDWQKRLISCLYRPFDSRPLYYADWMVDWPRKDMVGHVLKGNLCLASTRSIEIGRGFEHVFCSRNMIQHHAVSLKEVNYIFPLYLHPNGKIPEDLFAHEDGRRPNLSAKFIAEFSASLKLKFTPDGIGDLKKTFGPEDVFHYIYAVFHSPTYRVRYAEFLKIDFPRVPLTNDVKRFRRLCELGAELTALHLLESPALAKPITRYPIKGDNLVEKGHPKYLPPGEPDPTTGKPLKEGRVYIGKDDKKAGKEGQYFEGVPPDVWAFHVGGYQVCEKWLKDRRERRLTYEETEHYQKIIIALKETIRLMASVDAAISKWPME